jgi:uncharacterized protein
MQIPVGDILKQPGLSKEYHFEGPIDLVQVDLAGDITVDLKLTNVSSRILIKGTIKAPVFLTCSRCIEEFTLELEIPIEEEFLPEGSPELEEETMGWDNLSLFEYSQDQIDLYEVIRQNIISAIPYKALCAELCPGIKDSSTKSEKSEEQEGLSDEEKNSIDPRLLPLLNIRKKSQDS